MDLIKQIKEIKYIILPLLQLLDVLFLFLTLFVESMNYNSELTYKYLFIYLYFKIVKSISTELFFTLKYEFNIFTEFKFYDILIRYHYLIVYIYLFEYENLLNDNMKLMLLTSVLNSSLDFFYDNSTSKLFSGFILMLKIIPYIFNSFENQYLVYSMFKVYSLNDTILKYVYNSIVAFNIYYWVRICFIALEIYENSYRNLCVVINNFSVEKLTYISDTYSEFLDGRITFSDIKTIIFNFIECKNDVILNSNTIHDSIYE
jgi:hypothetical protein